MSQIFQNIEAARKQALKDRDTAKRTTLTTLAGEISTKAKGDGNRPVTDADCIKVLTGFINNAKQNVDYGVETAQAELDVYQVFMPAAKAQLSQEALVRSIRSIIANRLAGDGAKPVMKTVITDLKALHDGEYDPKVAAGLVKTVLDDCAEPN